MPENESDLLGQYANFSNPDIKPVLPVVDYHRVGLETKNPVANKVIRAIRGYLGLSDRIVRREIDFNGFNMCGAFSIGVPFESELGNRLFAKITVAGDLHRESPASDKIILEDVSVRKDPLVRKGRKEGVLEVFGEDQLAEVLNSDRMEVIRKMRDLAKEKNKIREILGEYIGEFLPKYYGTVITETPRQEIQKRMGPPETRLKEEHLKNVPISEITLMEIWEDVDSRHAEKKIRFGLEQDGPAIEMQKFASEVLRLIVERGVIIDICDGGGIVCLDKRTNKSCRVRGLSNLDNLDDNTILVPRNTVIDKKGHVKFFDTYPINQCRLGSIEIKKLVNIVFKPDWLTDSVKYLSSVTPDKCDEVGFIISYLYLLKKLGAKANMVS